VASERVRGREAEIAAGVKKLYYGIVQAEAGLRAREDSVRLHRELLRVVEEYANQRAVLPTDVLAMRAALMKEEHQLTAVRNAATGYREGLNAALGRGLDEPFAVEPLQPTRVTDEDLREAESRAVTNRSEVRIARLQSQQAEFDLRATRAPYTPDVSLAFNYTGFYGFEMLPRHGALFGVLATWEPWDWGRARAEREEKALVRSQAELAAGETEAMVRVDVRARFRAVQEAFDLVQVTTAAREAAREQLRVVTDRFRQQAALERELLEAQARLAQSDFDHQQALAGYWTARAEFERARGDQ
jgi:outer membrane protein TolC